MKIYTVIVTYNAMRWLRRCLECLKASTVDTSTIIVDNKSTDGTLSFVRENYPDIMVFAQEENLGFGQGNNVGIRYAMEQGADYVLLLNQDAYLFPDTLRLLCDASDGVSLLSPVQMNGDGSALDKMFRFLLSESETSLADDVLTGKGMCDTYEMRRVSAACWLMPASVIRSVGGFNPLFFHYGEDDNYLCRLHYHGIKVFVVTAAKMNHDRGEHGNVNVFNAGKLHRDILKVACDINMGLPQRLKCYARRLYECYAWDLRDGRYVPFAWLGQMWWLLTHSSQVSKSREKEKTKGMLWL